MKVQDITVLSLLGLLIWVVGTVYYGYRGPAILETTSTRYWTAFALSPVFSAALWTTAMLLLAIPGMIGEAVVLTHLPTFMPRLHAGSGGRYGAFLFATYAVVLGLAEVVTLRSAR
jgi:hypothetical protein